MNDSIRKKLGEIKAREKAATCIEYLVPGSVYSDDIATEDMKFLVQALEEALYALTNIAAESDEFGKYPAGHARATLGRIQKLAEGKAE